jgi:type III secretion protein J
MTLRLPASAVRAFCLAGLLLLTACKAELYSGLAEKDINEMAMVLQSRGIDTQRSSAKNGFALAVDSDNFTEAMAVLNANGLPRKQYKGLGVTFSGDKMVATPFEERARFMYALNEEIAQSLNQIAGVLSARVHITLPETAPFEKTKPRPRASVFLYERPSANVKTYVPVIKSLVMNSVDNLQYEDVTVAIFPANLLDVPVTPLRTKSGLLPVYAALALFLCAVLAGVLMLGGRNASINPRNLLSRLKGQLP